MSVQPPQFRECAACAAKPGAPTLCPVCLHNRTITIRMSRALLSILELTGEPCPVDSCGTTECDIAHLAKEGLEAP